MKKQRTKNVRVRKPRTPLQAAEHRMLTGCVEFLRKHGWKVAAIGGMNITSRGVDHNYTFGVHFTGLNPSLAAKSSTEPAAASPTPHPETSDHTPAP